MSDKELAFLAGYCFGVATIEINNLFKDKTQEEKDALVKKFVEAMIDKAIQNAEASQ